MGYVCRDKCRDKGTHHKNMYVEGLGYCSVCNKKMEGLRCMCCHAKLRFSPRNKEGKTRKVVVGY